MYTYVQKSQVNVPFATYFQCEFIMYASSNCKNRFHFIYYYSLRNGLILVFWVRLLLPNREKAYIGCVLQGGCCVIMVKLEYPFYHYFNPIYLHQDSLIQPPCTTFFCMQMPASKSPPPPIHMTVEIIKIQRANFLTTTHWAYIILLYEAIIIASNCSVHIYSFYSHP